LQGSALPSNVCQIISWSGEAYHSRERTWKMLANQQIAAKMERPQPVITFLSCHSNDVGLNMIPRPHMLITIPRTFQSVTLSPRKKWGEQPNPDWCGIGQNNGGACRNKLLAGGG
ncbi:MAG: hypothetical protein AAGA76_14060, partial [Pseudomonadota bacterium]